jgi:hypothetical protein
VNDVVRGNYPCSDGEALALAAFQVHAMLGNSALNFDYLSKAARTIFASRNWMTLGTNPTNVVNHINEERKKLGGMCCAVPCCCFACCWLRCRVVPRVFSVCAHLPCAVV